jgi:FAD:protein FMN transferase
VTGSFRAMGCEVVVAGADDESLRRIGRLFRLRERALSRFSPDSELSRVNASPATSLVVSDVLADALADAIAAARATEGLVDPTVAGALLAAGYDRDLAELSGDAELQPAGGPVPAGRVSEVMLVGRLLTRPPGLLLDLNGVVKSRAVDDAAALLPDDGFVSAGGDVAVSSPWPVRLPGGGSVTVRGGGVATSGTVTRRWTRGGRRLHHLIDPRVGAPSGSRWALVTVAAGSCLAADVAAKAAFLLDGDGPDWLDVHELPGRFVGDDGVVVVNSRWGDSVGASPGGREAA